MDVYKFTYNGTEELHDGKTCADALIKWAKRNVAQLEDTLYLRYDHLPIDIELVACNRDLNTYLKEQGK